MGTIAHTNLGAGRRIAIPAAICKQIGLNMGDRVVLETTEKGLMLRSYNDVVREVQASFANIAPPGVLLSEELIRDRRAEAARDD